MRHRYEVRFIRKVHLGGWYCLQFITAVLPFGKSFPFKTGGECLDFINAHALVYTDLVTRIEVSKMNGYTGITNHLYHSEKIFDEELKPELLKNFSDFIKTV